MYKSITLAAVGLLLFGTASAWKIEGRITEVADKDSVTAMIFRYWGNSGRSFVTDTIRDGRFSFSGTLSAEEGMVMMSVKSSTGQWANSLWVTDTTEILISGTADGKWTVASNEPEQAIEQETRTIDLSDLNALIESKEGYWKYRDSVWRVSAERLWPIYTKYPNSRAMLYSLNFYVRVGAVSHEKLQQIYDRLTPENRKSLEAQAIAVALDPPHVPQAGEPFGDFAGVDTTGMAWKLSDHAGKGKYILLDFWSTGCGGCYAAFPQLKEIHKKYGDRLTIVGVSLDCNKEMWRSTVKWHQLPWKHISDGMGTYAGAGVLYKTDVMPTYVLIDPDGTILDRWYPGQGNFQDRLIPHLEKQSPN